MVMRTQMSKTCDFMMKTEDGWSVQSFSEVAGLLYKDGECFVSGDECSCEVFTSSGTCDHISSIKGSREGTAVSLREARKILRSLVEEMSLAFDGVTIPEEPYKRNGENLVSMITLLLGKTKEPSSILVSGSGAWEGFLRGSGLKVRFLLE